MNRELDELSRRGVEVVAISFAPPQRLPLVRDELGLRFQLLSDPTRAGYEAFGMTRGSTLTVWGPRVIWRYLTLVARGRRLRRAEPGDDLQQLGGDAIVGADGRLRYHLASSGPTDRPRVAELLAVVDTL